MTSEAQEAKKQESGVATARTLLEDGRELARSERLRVAFTLGSVPKQSC
jgi:hypothetical protein